MVGVAMVLLGADPVSAYRPFVSTDAAVADPREVEIELGALTLRRIYVACSTGFISVFQADDPEHVRKIEDVPVERKVHSLAVDVKTHRVYAPEEEEQGRPVARMVVFDGLVRAPSDRR